MKDKGRIATHCADWTEQQREGNRRRLFREGISEKCNKRLEEV